MWICNALTLLATLVAFLVVQPQWNIFHIFHKYMPPLVHTTSPIRIDTNELSTWMWFVQTRLYLVLDTVILHSQVTPERPQIAQAHTNNFQNHAFGTYFSGLCLKIFLQCRLPKSGSMSVQNESDSECWNFISSNQQQIQNMTFQILNSSCKSQYSDTTRMQNPY